MSGRFVHAAFWYCCDFMANLGNLTHSSYHEAKTWVLLLLLPGLLAALLSLRITQYFQLKRLRHRRTAAPLKRRQ